MAKAAGAKPSDVFDLGRFIQNRAKDFAQNGAPFAPLRIKASTALDLYWATTRTVPMFPTARTKCSFYKVKGAGSFLPLGDIAIPGENPDPKATGCLLFSPMPGQEDALKHPVGFDYIMDGDGAMGAGGEGALPGRELNYFQPKPPEGYEALGMCFARHNQAPDPNGYWCVRRDLLTKIDRRSLWSDEGGRFKHNMDVHVPKLLDKQPVPSSGSMLLVPTTVTPGDRNFDMWAIRLKQVYIKHPAQDTTAEEPVASVHAKQDDQTRHGVKPIAVVPYTAINDRSGQPANESPFYFIVSEPYWQCLWTTNLAEKRHDEYTVGSSQKDSRTFEEKTTLSISASAGVEFGGANANVSSSYSHEFGLSTSRETTETSEVKKVHDWEIPANKVSALWQPINQITVYNSHHETVARIVYRNNDVRLLSAAEKKSAPRGKGKPPAAKARAKGAGRT